MDQSINNSASPSMRFGIRHIMILTTIIGIYTADQRYANGALAELTVLCLVFGVYLAPAIMLAYITYDVVKSRLFRRTNPRLRTRKQL